MRVLIVAREPQIRTEMKRDLDEVAELLEADGYAVATKILDSDPGIDAIVTKDDLGPGFRGVDLLARVRRRAPRVRRVLVSTGAAREELVDSGVAQACLAERWEPGELQRLVSESSRPSFD